MTIIDEARALQRDLIDLRRELHADPEVGLVLPRTQGRVLDRLDGLPLEITLGQETTSVVAVLRGGAEPADGEREVVLLRGDMDALPVQEDTGLPYASTNGAMHACGHDLHTAALIGAARILCAHRAELAGDVVLMFQPGEEGYDGAGVMLREGVLDAAGRIPDHAYALHVMSTQLPNGVWSARAGAVMSASYELDVTVRGAGGHGSAPHGTSDPVPVLAEIITSLQVMITRQFDIHDPVVLSVGVIGAGNARNVIPDTATLEATVRAYSEVAAERLHAVVPNLVESIAAAHRMTADVELRTAYPVTVNDADELDYVRGTIDDVVGAGRFIEMPAPSSGSEDFSRVLGRVPGAFFFLGACPPDIDPDGAPINHSPRAAFDDSVLADGAAVLAELALGRLSGASAPDRR